MEKGKGKGSETKDVSLSLSGCKLRDSPPSSLVWSSFHCLPNEVEEGSLGPLSLPGQSTDGGDPDGKRETVGTWVSVPRLVTD